LGFGGAELFVFWVLFLLGLLFWRCVWAWFGALSMLLKVTFDVVKSDVYHDAAALLGLRV